MKKQLLKIKLLALAIITLCCLTAASKAQTTAFTYQGRFNDASVASPTNGTYQMQFKIFDAAQVGTGSQIENTITLSAVQVVDGIFTVQLDFGSRAFTNGSGNRFIEISVQPAGGSGYTTLSPRQQFTSAPFAIRSLNADFAASSSNAVQLGGITASGYTLNTDARLSNERSPAAGSANYIQNQITAVQPADFNIGGSGTIGGFFGAASINSQTNYKINTKIVFGTPNQSSVAAGQMANYNVTGADNTFLGYKTGAATNAAVQGNTFIGSGAGKTNTTGANNTFVGNNAGATNTSGAKNSVFGFSAAAVGDANIVAGYAATAEGNSNTSLGIQSSSSGNNNVTIGTGNFTNGNSNTIIGDGAYTGASGPINNSTAIGAGAKVSTSNTIVLGTGSEWTFIPGKLSVTGKTAITTLGTAGSTSLCRNSFNEISTCTAGNLTGDDSRAMMKEINDQKARIETQQATIDGLKKLVCASNPTAEICREEVK